MPQTAGAIFPNNKNPQNTKTKTSPPPKPHQTRTKETPQDKRLRHSMTKTQGLQGQEAAALTFRNESPQEPEKYNKELLINTAVIDTQLQ